MTTTTKPRRTKAPRPEVTAEQREQWATERDAKIEQAHKTISDAVAAITSGEDWKAFLRFAASLHRYSFNNVMLVHVQAAQRGMATPTRLAAFGKWASLKHPVRKGEKGLAIFAPVIVTIKPDDPRFVPGSDNRRLVGFKVVSTFDVQQVTDPETVPTDPTLGLFSGPVTGEVPDSIQDGLVRFAKESGYAYRYGTDVDLGQAEAHTDEQRHEIVMHERHRGTVRETLIMVHEITHMLLHTGKDEDGSPLYNYGAHRGMAETEAEGTAYVVATYFGIDPGQTSAGYVANWSKDGTDQIVRAGTRIMSTAKKIIDAVLREIPDTE